MKSNVESKVEKFEQELEKRLEKLTTHPLVLKGVSTLINLNSQRRIFSKKALETFWRKVELPVRRDQEKMVFLLQELQFQIEKMESELEDLREKEAQRNEPVKTNTKKLLAEEKIHAEIVESPSEPKKKAKSTDSVIQG